MRELNAAYEVLSSELRRREYDRDCGKAPDHTPNDASAMSTSQDAKQSRQETTKKGAGADVGIMRAFTLLGLIVIGAVFWAVAPNSQVSEKTEPTEASASQKQTLVPRGSEKPSFDCAKAKTAPARLICADGELARLDGELGVTFRKQKAQISAQDQSKSVAEERAWIDTRNTRCDLDGKNGAAIEVLASSKPCMVTAIQERIVYLTQTEAAAIPAVAGEYTTTTPAPSTRWWCSASGAYYPAITTCASGWVADDAQHTDNTR